MALQDLLQAITDQATERIAQAKAEYEARIAEWKTASTARIAQRKTDLMQQKDEKLANMKAKALSHSDSIRKNRVLQKKQDLLDQLFDTVEEQLGNLSGDQLNSLLTSCLDHCEEGGTITPSKKHEEVLKKLAGKHYQFAEAVNATGGFTYALNKKEEDFTFHSLVHNHLRPKKMLDVAHKLFTV